jgi:hypothetical protein
VHVLPRTAPTVQVRNAVAVTEAEYDSEDDSSDGDTVEDVTVRMGRNRLSDSPSVEADLEFRQTWGNAYRDRNAVPKKGILKRECGSHDQRSSWEMGEKRESGADDL